MHFVDEEKYKNVFGIYQIKNIVSGLVYIGQTRENFERRYFHHRWKLRKGTHDNPWLQASFNKYGEDAFYFSVIQVVDNSDALDELEIQFIKKARLSGHCCNMLDGGGGRKGIPLPEYRRKELGELNRILNTGKKASQETRDKMSRARRGIKRPSDIYVKMVETKSQKLLNGQTSKIAKLTAENVKDIKIQLMNNVSFQDLAEQYHVSASNINAIRSNRSWQFVEVEGWSEYCATHLHNTRARQSRSAN